MSGHGSPESVRRRSVWRRAALGVLAALVFGEVAARIVLSVRWSEEKRRSLTHPVSEKGRMAAHPYLPYQVRAAYGDHNDYGFRGPPFDITKPPGRVRIVCLGASTTYGEFVPARQAYAAQLEELLRDEGHNVEVLNAGTPGWVSVESLIQLQLHVLPLDPDLVVIQHGRNELFPEAFGEFQPDYSHFRKPDYSFHSANQWHKPLFRLSHAALILFTYGQGRFGWSPTDEHPAYGCIEFDNRPANESLVANLRAAGRDGTFRNALDSMSAICRARDIEVILCTHAFHVEKFRSGVLSRDPALFDALGARLERNNEIVREVAARHRVPVADFARDVQDPALYFDDCHLTAEGHQRAAGLLLATIRSNQFLPAASEQRNTDHVSSRPGSPTTD